MQVTAVFPSTPTREEMGILSVPPQEPIEINSMKKTLIAIMALSGIVAGATVDDALFGISDFKGATSTIDINNTGETLTLTDSTTKEGYLEISGANFSHNTYKDNGQGKRAYITLTFVIDLAKLTTPTADTPFFLDNVESNTNTATSGWGTVLTTDRKFKGAWDGVSWNNSDNYTTTALGNTGTAVLTFNTGWDGVTGTSDHADPEGTGSYCYSQVYLNGVQISQTDKGKGLAHGSTVNTIFINEAFVDAIEEMYVHNSMVHGNEATSLYNSVIPEPTTATLSLLALAGLAARRRRK